MTVSSCAVLQILHLGIEVWKRLLRYEKDKTFVCVFPLLCSPALHLHRDCQAQATTVPQPFHIHLAQTGARQFGSQTIHTVPCLGMDLVILIFFFVPTFFVSIVKTQGKRARGKKTSLTEAQSIISQVFDWSDCKRSRRFPRALDWDGLELARNKTQFSRSEETAVLNKTSQRMHKKRLPAEDKVESWLLSPPVSSSIPLLHTAYHIAWSF